MTKLTCDGCARGLPVTLGGLHYYPCGVFPCAANPGREDSTAGTPTQEVEALVQEEWNDEKDDTHSWLARWREKAINLAQRLEEAQRERDLAIAHDRQPYPTADAYEKVCAARTKWQERAQVAESNLSRIEAETVEKCAKACRAVYEVHKKQGAYPVDMGGLALECEAGVRALLKGTGK